MWIAREALTLFMRSLPEGCTFSIVSFGDPEHKPLYDNIYYLEYTDGTRDAAIKEILKMSANFGGTNILKPLKAVQTGREYDSGLMKRVFLLTDGSVSEQATLIR